MAWLVEMNSLMEKNPQAAYDSLCNHRQDMSQCGEKVEGDTVYFGQYSHGK